MIYSVVVTRFSSNILLTVNNESVLKTTGKPMVLIVKVLTNLNIVGVKC